MCGIFGVIAGHSGALTAGEARLAATSLFKLSEARGKEASGLAFADPGAVRILKRPVTASKLLQGDDCQRLIDSFAASMNGSQNGSREPHPAGSGSLIGHSRLVTDGIRDVHTNNQPLVAGGMIGIHNGIVVNAADLWRRYPQLERRYEVDTEIIFELLRLHYSETGSLTGAVGSTFRELEGTAAIAAFFSDLDQVLLATNNGSLYTVRTRGGEAVFFASETFFLRKLAERRGLRDLLEDAPIVALQPGSASLIDLRTLERRDFLFDQAGDADTAFQLTPRETPRDVVDLSDSGDDTRSVRRPARSSSDIVEELKQRYPFDDYPISSMRRCSRCILPETIPFITFDSEGVCNFCHSYRKLTFRGEDALMDVADRYRKANGEHDCIVAVSGGRDSTYALHYVKTVLKMNPLAFTYDWGMVTDLARRNVARICGKLGVEHILLSADIPRKRHFIRQNVLAWLERPRLGLIPLFMAGDKAYFYNAYQLKKRTGLELLIMGENMLERDFFKACFAGSPPEMTSDEHIGHLSWKGNLKMILFYLQNYLANPRFLNSSIPDTVFAYLCYFVIPRDYLNMFRYIPWHEESLISTLVDEYDWELATDTTQTWRIGDGTSPFYNFIYYNVAGFSENDNFYSNQIREGTISREQALATVADRNQPRFEGIKWYCDTIGIDVAETVAKITAIPKLYRKES